MANRRDCARTLACLSFVGVIALAGCAGPETTENKPESSTVRSSAVADAEAWMAQNTPGAESRGGVDGGMTAVEAGGGPAEGDVREAGDALRDMRGQQTVNQGASKALLKQAQRHRELGELLEAEEKLAQAIALWPANEEAQRLLDSTQLLLGDRRGEVRTLSRDLQQQGRVKRQLLRFSIEKHINKAMHAVEALDFDAAINHYKLAIDAIQHVPHDMGIDEYLERARQGLAKSQEAKKKKDFEDRQAILDMINRQKAQEEATSLEFVENHIRALRRRASSAMESEDFDKAGDLYEQILTLNPNDIEALTQRRLARERHHLQQTDRFMRASVDNFERAVLAVEESSVIYQEIFRYPEKEEWERITPKVADITEQIAKFETPVEKAIRAKLSQPITYGLEDEVPLRDALKELQALTGVNFFIHDADLGDAPVQLERLTNLPLENVLGFLLEKAGGEVGSVIKEGAVVISSDETQLEKPRYLRFYEISDLITRRPDFPAPPLALDELAGKDTSDAAADIDFGDDDDDGSGSETLDAEELLALIGRELNALKAAGGDDDEDSEELPEGIRIQNGKLMALTSLENHIHLATMLERFRKAMGMMVTVESRFLDIQDNFLESIGINFGSGNQTFLQNSIPDIDGEGTQVAPGYEFIDARGDFNLRAASIGALSNPIGSQVNPFNISGSGGGAYQINILDAERFQLEALLTGVAKEQEIRRLNSPRVTAFNTQVAHTLVVNQAAYIQDLEVNQTGVIPVINPVIGVLNTGSILEVRPTISYDRKFIVLEIQPTLAEQIGQDVAVLNLAGGSTVVPVQLPIISVTKIKTTVNVPDGGTVLLGGLKREIKTDTSIGLPIFRQIPIMNLFFGRKASSTLRSNLFVLINAKVTVVHEEEARLFGTGA